MKRPKCSVKGCEHTASTTPVVKFTSGNGDMHRAHLTDLSVCRYCRGVIKALGVAGLVTDEVFAKMTAKLLVEKKCAPVRELTTLVWKRLG